MKEAFSVHKRIKDSVGGELQSWVSQSCERVKHSLESAAFSGFICWSGAEQFPAEDQLKPQFTSSSRCQVSLNQCSDLSSCFRGLSDALGSFCWLFLFCYNHRALQEEAYPSCAPWTGRQSDARLTHRDRKPFALIFIKLHLIFIGTDLLPNHFLFLACATSGFKHPSFCVSLRASCSWRCGAGYLPWSI